MVTHQQTRPHCGEQPTGVPRVRRRGLVGFAAAAGAALLWAVPVAHGTIDPNLNLVTSSVLWTGTIHHIRTDTLATGFQKWDTTVMVDPQGARATTVFSTQYTVNVDCAGVTATDTVTGSGSYSGPVKRERISAGWFNGQYDLHFVVPQGTRTLTTTGPCASAPISGSWSDSGFDTPGDVGFDDEGPLIGGPLGQTRLSADHTVQVGAGGFSSSFEDHVNLTMCGEPSGTSWVDGGPFTTRLGARFPQSREVADLKAPFRAHVRSFLAALAHAKRGTTHSIHTPNAPIAPYITTTFRPDERAWLMNTAYRVAGGWQKFRPQNPPLTAASKANLGVLEPAKVPPYPHGGVERVPICWLHQDENGNPDPQASKKAATQMKRAFQVAAFGAAYPSNHSRGRAIDMNFRWPRTVSVRDGSGHWVTIPAGSSTTSHPMWALGQSFGVVKQKTGDPPHWSVTGH